MKGVKPFKDWKLIELTPPQKTGCWITGLLMVALGVVVIIFCSIKKMYGL